MGPMASALPRATGYSGGLCRRATAAKTDKDVPIFDQSQFKGRFDRFGTKNFLKVAFFVYQVGQAKSKNTLRFAPTRGVDRVLIEQIYLYLDRIWCVAYWILF